MPPIAAGRITPGSGLITFSTSPTATAATAGVVSAPVTSQIVPVLNTAPGILAVFTTAIANLPTTLPASTGVLWNNGGSLQIS